MVHQDREKYVTYSAASPLKTYNSAIHSEQQLSHQNITRYSVMLLLYVIWDTQQKLMTEVVEDETVSSGTVHRQFGIMTAPYSLWHSCQTTESSEFSSAVAAVPHKTRNGYCTYLCQYIKTFIFTAQCSFSSHCMLWRHHKRCVLHCTFGSVRVWVRPFVSKRSPVSTIDLDFWHESQPWTWLA